LIELRLNIAHSVKSETLKLNEYVGYKIYIIIMRQFGCLSVSRARAGLGWAGGIAGQGPSAPVLVGHIGRLAAASALRQGAAVFTRL